MTPSTVEKRASLAPRSGYSPELYPGLHAVLAAARMATWRWDPSADQVTASAALEELFGLLPGTTVASSSQGFALVHPDDVGCLRSTVAAVGCTGGSWHAEFRILRPAMGRLPGSKRTPMPCTTRRPAGS